MATGEIIIREATSKDDFRVIQKGQVIESINKSAQVFHTIDLSYAKDGILFHSWIGYRTNDQLKQVLDGHFAKIYEQHKFKKMIIENSKMSGSFDEANDWMATYFMPKLVKLGLQYVAVVLPANVFAKISVEEWDKKIGGFTSRNFGSSNEAFVWLRSL
jgi:hypothetical protein